MPNCHIDELHIENIDQVGLTFADFYLLYEGLQKNLHGDWLVLLENDLEIAKHKFPHGEFLVVFDEQEGYFLVHNGGVRVLFVGKLVQ